MGMRLMGPAPLRPLCPPLGSRPVSCVLRTLLAQGKGSQTRRAAWQSRQQCACRWS